MNIVKNIKKNARDVLINESPPIQNQATLIHETSKACVKEIYSVTGRIVVIGVGKSSKIANKIVAMRVPTVKPKRYLLTDYPHRRLTMKHPEDLLMKVTTGANTPALKLLIPIFKRSGSKLVALAGNSNSCVGRQGDFLPSATIAEEGPQPTPTIRRATRLAKGNVLGAPLLALLDFSRNVFAKYHAGATLCKQLYLKVSHIHTDNELQAKSPKSVPGDLIPEIRLCCLALTNSECLLKGANTGGGHRWYRDRDIKTSAINAIAAFLKKLGNEACYGRPRCRYGKPPSHSELLWIERSEQDLFTHTIY